MAELSTIARPYAKAAFEHAVAAGTLPQWSAMLGLLAAVAEDPAVHRLLESPELTANSKAESLVALCGESLDVKGVNFVRVLAESRRLALLPDILLQFDRLKANLERTVDVAVVAAREMGVDQTEKLAGVLSARLQRDVRISVSVDPSLLGGAVIRAGDTVIDGSVRGRLAKLAEALLA